MRSLLLLIILALSLSGCSTLSSSGEQKQSGSNGDQVIRRAFEQRSRNVPVEGSGVVKKILSDDNDGSRHQRFILELNSGQSILIAHNIDLAPRVAGIRVGDTVEFRGVYKWNPQGGVVHWTHGDPRGQHAAGWLKCDGKTFE